MPTPNKPLLVAQAALLVVTHGERYASQEEQASAAVKIARDIDPTLTSDEIADGLANCFSTGALVECCDRWHLGELAKIITVGLNR
ncbi:hypothetical protein ENKOMM257B_06960 [Enterobacter kobei]|uniref:hypothetical protein n=1 Tax=Enterobacter kobei TaxID=208224 RepID=UPI003B2786C9